MRCGKNEGGRGGGDSQRGNIIMCHRTWGSAKTHAVNNLCFFFFLPPAEPVVVSLNTSCQIRLAGLTDLGVDN